MRNSRVLIVDDSLTIRAMLEELVATRGHCPAIAVAADVPSARALIASFRPTVITLDLNMPGMDGMTLLDELRDYPHAPIIVVSSAAQEGSATAEAAIAHGADGCFDKGKIVSESARFIRVLKKASIRKIRRSRTGGTMPVPIV